MWYSMPLVNDAKEMNKMNFALNVIARSLSRRPRLKRVAIVSYISVYQPKHLATPNTIVTACVFKLIILDYGFSL